MTGTPLAPPPPRALLDPNGNVSDRFYQWLGSLQKGISGAFPGIGEEGKSAPLLSCQTSIVFSPKR